MIALPDGWYAEAVTDIVLEGGRVEVVRISAPFAAPWSRERDLPPHLRAQWPDVLRSLDRYADQTWPDRNVQPALGRSEPAEGDRAAWCEVHFYDVDAD